MFVAFSELPENTRIWIYQADKNLGVAEKTLIEKQLLKFTSTWTAHDEPLDASFTILEDRFVILAVNEEANDASGCSIDKSTSVMRAISSHTGIDFFNRTLVLFEIQGELKQIAQGQLRQKFQEGMWNEDSITFNTLVDTVGGLRQNWKITASRSWVKRYIGPRTFDSISG